jgi:hypothetical protein
MDGAGKLRCETVGCDSYAMHPAARRTTEELFEGQPYARVPHALLRGEGPYAGLKLAVRSVAIALISFQGDHPYAYPEQPQLATAAKVHVSTVRRACDHLDALRWIVRWQLNRRTRYHYDASALLAGRPFARLECEVQPVSNARSEPVSNARAEEEPLEEEPLQEQTVLTHRDDSRDRDESPPDAQGEVVSEEAVSENNGDEEEYRLTADRLAQLQRETGYRPGRPL